VGAAARRVADGDLAARVAERGSGEVGDLGRSFNAMADSLEHTRDELESQNSELEAQQAELERAVDELADGQARFERLYRIGRAISSAHELEDVAQTVVDELGELTGAELGVVYACTREDRTEFGAVAFRGIDAEGLPAVRPGVGLAGRAVAEGGTVVAGGAGAGAGIAVETLGGRIVARHEVHVPLASGSDTVGVLTLVRASGGPFSPDDLELLEYLAGRAGVGVANALTLRTVGDQAALNRAVLDTAADAFLSIGAGGAIAAWNPAAERLFGWTSAEAIGADVQELLVPERSRPALASLLAGEELQNEFDVRHRDGHELPVEVVMSPLERHGELTHNAFARDISERRRADLYMGAQYAVTRVLSESSTLAEARDGVIEALGRALGWHVGIAWLVDEDEDVLRPTSLWASDEVDAAEFLELTTTATIRRGEPLPGRVWETGDPVWIEDLSREPPFPRAGAAKRAGLHASLSFPVISGSRFIGMAEFFSSEVARPDPELLTLLGTVGTQIGQFSERKRAEHEADRLKDEFFALVSHELRTPLTSIIGYLEMVLEDPAALSEEARRFLHVVERNSRRLHRLVGDLLFVAQVEAGRLSLDRSPVPLAQTVTDSVEAARPRAEEDDVALRLRADAVGDCEGDGDRIGQMLDNLISNALKFTPAGGAVDVYLTERGGRALLEVRDSGVGIPADEQSRLFQRFFRSSTATERAIPGVGLGLTISRAIVEAHGGTIDFESEEGRGTTFRVELPLVRQPSTHHPSETPREVVL
jgi:PAS domain S-box-containing protein